MKSLFIPMALFTIFCGAIYNDFFGAPLLIYDSCYNNFTFQRKQNDCVYPMGLDWIWAKAENETAFINSFKMKFSIIIGVIHMLLGSFLKGMNAIHFKKHLDLFFEAIPQFIFMLITFGYMSICIVIKWVTIWDLREPVSIISIFINFTSIEIPLYSTKSV